MSPKTLDGKPAQANVDDGILSQQYFFPRAHTEKKIGSSASILKHFMVVEKKTFCWKRYLSTHTCIFRIPEHTSCLSGRVTRARILKHLLEAEKSTFREELSFQRSESTIGLLQAAVFVYDRKDSFL